MQTIEITGWIFARKTEWDIKPSFTFFSFDASEGDPSYMKVCEHKIVAEMPADWNPVAAEVAALEAEKERVRKQLNARIKQINERLSKIQALPFEPVEAQA